MALEMQVCGGVGKVAITLTFLQDVVKCLVNA